MRRIGLGVVFCAASIFSPIVARAQTPKDIAMLSSKQSTYVLKLSSNPTTGYTWLLEQYDEHLLSLVSYHYQPSGGKLMGVGGSDIWTFKLQPAAFAANRLIKIHLLYARPWEVPNGTKKTFYLVTESAFR